MNYMKKTLILAAMTLVLASCGGDDQANKSGDKQATPSGESLKDPDVEKGLELVAGNDCLGCHQIKAESTGPAYMAIADRYRNRANAADTLVQKIIQGGTGNWGQVPMSAHPNVTPEQAQLMVKYILSLKE